MPTTNLYKQENLKIFSISGPRVRAVTIAEHLVSEWKRLELTTAENRVSAVDDSDDEDGDAKSSALPSIFAANLCTKVKPFDFKEM